jgi:hypothetical protein
MHWIPPFEENKVGGAFEKRVWRRWPIAVLLSEALRGLKNRRDILQGGFLRSRCGDLAQAAVTAARWTEGGALAAKRVS